MLEREFISTFGQRDIREIKRWDVLRYWMPLLAEGQPIRRIVFTRTSQAVQLVHRKRDCRDQSIVGLKSPTKELSRDRVLDDDEIVRLLRSCRNDVYPFRQFVPMLLATAQRRGELAEMRWSEIDLKTKSGSFPPIDRRTEAACRAAEAYALEILSEVPTFSRLRFCVHDYPQIACERLFEDVAAIVRRPANLRLEAPRSSTNSRIRHGTSKRGTACC